MKATLEFNLPEEREEHKDALNGSRYKSQIETLYTEVFRPHIKYGQPLLTDSEGQPLELTTEQFAVIESIWEKVNAHFNEEE